MKKNYFILLLLATIGCLASTCEQNKPTIDASQYNQDAPNDSNVKAAEPNQLDSERRREIQDDYRNTNRRIWQKPDLVIDFMGEITDKVVADIGAGTGFFSFPIARKAAKVIAIDIDQSLVRNLDSAKVMELPEYAQDRLEARLATNKNPNLGPGEADIVLMVNTYMYIRAEEGKEYLRKIIEALPENGVILIIDFKKKKLNGPVQYRVPPEDRVPLYQVEIDLEEMGFRNIESNDKVLDYQYIVKAMK